MVKHGIVFDLILHELFNGLSDFSTTKTLSFAPSNPSLTGPCFVQTRKKTWKIYIHNTGEHRSRCCQLPANYFTWNPFSFAKFISELFFVARIRCCLCSYGLSCDNCHGTSSAGPQWQYFWNVIQTWQRTISNCAAGPAVNVLLKVNSLYFCQRTESLCEVWGKMWRLSLETTTTTITTLVPPLLPRLLLLLLRLLLLLLLLLLYTTSWWRTLPRTLHWQRDSPQPGRLIGSIFGSLPILKLLPGWWFTNLSEKHVVVN